MSLNEQFQKDVLDAMLGGTASLLGATVDLALSKADPGEDGTGLDEPVGNGYARVTVNNDGVEWDAAITEATLGVKKNTNQISFPAASGGNWGLITHWALFDAGVMKLYGIIDNGAGASQPTQVNDGDTFKFLAGKLRITLD